MAGQGTDGMNHDQRFETARYEVNINPRLVSLPVTFALMWGGGA